jgi:hypothetical protein
MPASWSASPKTWASGAVSATEMNTEIRDRMDWLKAALTTHGITSDSAVQFLMSARKGVSATTSGQAVNDAVDRPIPFTAANEEWDDAAFHSDTNNTRFYAPVTGTYDCKGQISYAADASGRREIWIEANGTDEWNRVRVPTVGSSAATAIMTTADIYLVAGEYVILYGRQSSGGSLDVSSRFQMRLVSV